MRNNHGNNLCAAERVRRVISDVINGALIVVLGIIACSTTVTFVASGETLRFLTEGLIICGLGCVMLGAGATQYLKAALEIGYTDDSI